MVGQILLLVFLSGIPARTSPGLSERQTDSLAAVLRISLSKLSTPELEQRKAARREMQQRGYVSVLHEALREDGVTTLLAWVRLMLHLHYALPRNTLVLYVSPPAHTGERGILDRLAPPPSPPIPIPLREDRSFPTDPWHRGEPP